MIVARPLTFTQYNRKFETPKLEIAKFYCTFLSAIKVAPQFYCTFLSTAKVATAPSWHSNNIINAYNVIYCKAM